MVMVREPVPPDARLSTPYQSSRQSSYMLMFSLDILVSPMHQGAQCILQPPHLAGALTPFFRVFYVRQQLREQSRPSHLSFDPLNGFYRGDSSRKDRASVLKQSSLSGTFHPSCTKVKNLTLPPGFTLNLIL